jgi:RNA polymerase sigma-70 factor (ECF subfamily)
MLYSRYERRIYNLVRRIVGQRPEVDDLTAEVFYRVYRGAKTYVPKAKFKTWLYRNAINLCSTALKRRKHLISLDAPVASEDDPEEEHTIEVADPTSDPALWAERREMMEHVKKSLSQLPAEQKQAMIMLVYDQMSSEEIATVTGSTVKAVKSRIHRARERLRILLKEYMPEPRQNRGTESG